MLVIFGAVIILVMTVSTPVASSESSFCLSFFFYATLCSSSIISVKNRLED